MLKRLLSADGLASAGLRASVQDFATRYVDEGATVLDLGCGDMPYRSVFTSRGASYTGADIEGRPDLLIEADKPLPLPDDSVHLVVSFQVLEHVRDVPYYLASAKRVMKDGGKLFLSTHGVWPYHPHPTDFWRWTRDGLCETLERSGFRIIRITPICGPAAWLAMFPMLALKKLLGPAWALMVPANICVNLLAHAIDRLTPTSIRTTNAAIYAVEAEKAS